MGRKSNTELQASYRSFVYKAQVLSLFTYVLYWDKFQSMLLFVFAKNFYKHMESVYLICHNLFCQRNFVKEMVISLLNIIYKQIDKTRALFTKQQAPSSISRL